jgi:guanylate kinase
LCPPPGLCYNLPVSYPVIDALDRAPERSAEPAPWEADRNGRLLVVSGPSAVGKDTVLDALLALSDEDLPYTIRKCVTTTTRQPRPGETEGLDYNFVSVTQFNRLVAEDDLLEYAEVHDNYYGTPRAYVASAQAQGVDVILKIDVQGGRTVKRKMPDAVLIFLQPPSLAELERRLRGRATESEDDIARRLLNARREMAQRQHYDYAVTNDSVEEAVDTIRAIIRAEHCRIHMGPPDA